MSGPVDQASREFDQSGIHILIVTGVLLFGEGLSDALGRIAGFHVLGARRVGPDAVAAVAELRPHVVLLDMSTPDSLTVARSLRRNSCNPPVVALAVGRSDHELLACAEAGIAGYLTSDSSLGDLIAAVKSATQGEVICSPYLTGRIVERLAALATDRVADWPHAKLTSRERQIVTLLESELSNKEIAAHLGIEATTVKNHMHNLLEKLNVRRRIDVIRLISRSTNRGAADGHVRSRLSQRGAAITEPDNRQKRPRVVKA